MQGLYHKEVRKQMPLYEYQCHQCKDRFELLQSMNITAEQIAKIECPNCGTVNPQKVFSTFCGQTANSLTSRGSTTSAPPDG